MVKHVLNKTRNTTWTINSDDDIWILGEKGRISGDVVNMMGISTSSYVDNATIRIDGEIDLEGANSMGIYVTSKSARITVSKEAHVSATGNAALYYSNGSGKVALDNKGLLQGEWAVQIGAAQNGALIRNDGRILGVGDAIIAIGAGAMIVNTGIIKGGNTGIDLEEGQNDIDPLKAENATRIVNSGKITGSDYSIDSDNVAVNIRNKGLLSGDVWMDSGDDVFNNRRGTINGDVYGYDGDDVFNMAGGKINGVIYGGSGNDVVTLGSPAQVYVEYSGQGTDTVRINGSYQLGAHIEGLVLLGKANHTGIGNSQGNDIFGNKGDNVLYGQTGADWIRGGAGNDTLFGGTDDDELNGGAGRDILSGGDGDDRLIGGDGADILTGGEGSDEFHFEPGNGRDTITDFEQGSDLIYLYGFGVFADIEEKIRYSDGNAVIDLGDGDMIVIRNILPNTPLTDADFDFY